MVTVGFEEVVSVWALTMAPWSWLYSGTIFKCFEYSGFTLLTNWWKSGKLDFVVYYVISRFVWFELCIFSNSWMNKVHFDSKSITVSCPYINTASARACLWGWPLRSHIFDYFWIFKWGFHDLIEKRWSSALFWYDIPGTLKINFANRFFLQYPSKCTSKLE